MAMNSSSHDVAERVERRWATLVIVIILVLIGMVVYTGLQWAMMPPHWITPRGRKTMK